MKTQVLCIPGNDDEDSGDWYLTNESGAVQVSLGPGTKTVTKRNGRTTVRVLCPPIMNAHHEELSQAVAGCVPLVHLNGSGATRLLEDNARAQAAITEAVTVLMSMPPHGRDFYPRGDSECRVALVAHLRRAAILQAVKEELEAISEGIERQVRR